MALRRGLATALQRARKYRRLTQEDFSDVSSRTYLSSLERGIKSPTLEKIEAIASVLKIHPLTLLTLACLETEGGRIDDLLKLVAKELQSLEHSCPK